MRRLRAIVSLLALTTVLLTLPGWAAGYPLCPQDGREYFYATDADGNFVCIDKERVQWTWECKHRGEWAEAAGTESEVDWDQFAVDVQTREYVPDYYYGPLTEYVTGDEVATLLERCLEYVRDGDRNYLENSMYDTLLYVEPYRTLKDDARDKLNALDRETKLRRDIEALLGKLKGEKP